MKKTSREEQAKRRKYAEKRAAYTKARDAKKALLKNQPKDPDKD